MWNAVALNESTSLYVMHIFSFCTWFIAASIKCKNEPVIFYHFARFSFCFWNIWYLIHILATSSFNASISFDHFVFEAICIFVLCCKCLVVRHQVKEFNARGDLFLANLLASRKSTKFQILQMWGLTKKVANHVV